MGLGIWPRLDVKQLEFIHPKLRELLAAIGDHFGEQNLLITSLYRIGDSGVHGTLPLRGTDLHSWSAVWGRNVASWANGEWIYNEKNPEKAVALYHDAGNGFHVHLQVHPNTRRK